VENVAALLNRGLDEVLGSLAESGYDAEWQMLRASEFGLPHRRERLFLVAYDASIIRRKGRVFCESREHRTPKQFRGLLSSENEFKTRGWSLQNESPFLRGVDGISSRIHIDRLISNEVHTCTYDVKKTHAGKALLELQSENGKEENGQPIGINERIQEKEVLLFPVLRELDDCTSRNHHETCCPEESAKSDQSKPMSEVWKNGSEIESASRGSSESVGCSNPLLKVPCGRGSEARELSDQEKSNMCDLRECVSSEGFSSSQNMLREVPIGNGKDKRKQEMALQMNRLRALGNAIVPQCAQFVGQCILDSIRTEAAQ
jgi:site-specific DNA-cytosine methylase